MLIESSIQVASRALGVKVKSADIALPSEFDAKIVKEKDDVDVGVPLTIPLLVFKDIPLAGRPLALYELALFASTPSL